MENQARIKKLAIETRTDSNGNDPGMVNGTTVQIYGVGTYYRHRKMAKKFKPAESILMHLQVATIHYVKYRNEVSKDKALRELINDEEVTEVSK